MKLLPIMLLASLFVQAQNPVTWDFRSNKLADKKFEIHLTATIQRGWHLYSQTQPDDAIAIPTEIILNKNPVLAGDLKFKEVGQMQKFHDPKLKVSANQYADKVEFVCTVTLKTNVITAANGTVEFQVCDDEKCLPPKKEKFSILLQ